MGRSQKPLTIWVDARMGEWPEIAALRAQGHNLRLIANGWEMVDVDLIMGPTCWLMDESHRKYLPLALAEARKRRYPKEKE